MGLIMKMKWPVPYPGAHWLDQREDRAVLDVLHQRSLFRYYGVKKAVEFTLGPDDLALLSRQMRWEVEPGEFEVRVGSSCQKTPLSGRFLVTEE